jgi:lactobin A/cerein 7B family class IIb bacteriocin
MSQRLETTLNMLHEPSGIRTLSPEELDEVNGGCLVFELALLGVVAAGAAALTYYTFVNNPNSNTNSTQNNQPANSGPAA